MAPIDLMDEFLGEFLNDVLFYEEIFFRGVKLLNSIFGYDISEYWNHSNSSSSEANYNTTPISKNEGENQLSQNQREPRLPQNLQEIGKIVSSFFSSFTMSRSQKAEQQREDIRQSVINDITRLKQSNLQCQELFQWMESLIKSNSSLHALFKSCLKDLQKNPILPIQIVDERSVGDELIDRWGREQTTEHYWYAIKTRVRLFFERNSEFYLMLDRQLKETPLSEFQQSFWKELTPAFLEDIDGYEKSEEDQFRIVEVGEDGNEIEDQPSLISQRNERPGSSSCLNRWASSELRGVVFVHSRNQQSLEVDLLEIYPWLRTPSPLPFIRLGSFQLITRKDVEILKIWNDTFKKKLPDFRICFK